MIERWLTMSDGHHVYVKSWGEDQAIETKKAVIQLAHGMAEHIQRYQPLAEFLSSRGYLIYGHDHRGHGKTGEKSASLGFFANEDGFERVVEDVKEINDYIHTIHPDLPVFIMGHSMGSFIVRRFLQRYKGAVAGAIISGTGGNPGLMGKVGKRIAKSQMKKLGKQAKSPLMNKLIFGGYNKKVSNPETDFDWLTRNKKEVDKYINDPYCGFIATAGFYYDLLRGIDVIHQNKEVAKMEKDIPYFFISGTEDPVGQATKGVISVINQLKRNGIKQLDYKFYHQGRHEVLNELNHEEVKADIINWLDNQLNQLRSSLSK